MCRGTGTGQIELELLLWQPADVGNQPLPSCLEMIDGIVNNRQCGGQKQAKSAIGLEFLGTLVTGSGLFQQSLIMKSGTQVAVGFGTIGLELDCLSVAGDRFV